VTPPPCLYCRREGGPRTREHVLQDAFGATAVLEEEVCAECNGAFSSLDKDLVDAVNFWHLGEKIRRALGLGVSVGNDGVALRARLRPDGFAEHPPQLYETAPNEWRVLASDERSLRAVIAEIASPSDLAVTARVVSPEGGRPALFILRSGPRKYLIEGTDERRVNALSTEMTTRGLQVRSLETVQSTPGEGNPPLRHDLSLDLRCVGRALAKVALNFVCYRLGASTALQATFDPVRHFAREDRGDLWAFVKPSLLTGMDNTVAEPFITGRQHVLVLLRDREGAVPRETVFVVVAGKFIGTVSLQPEGIPAEGLQDGTWLVSRCDPAKHQWEDLRMPDDAFRAFVNPAALGMEAAFKAVGAHRRAGQ
jgi:hypothetical protein